MMNKYALGMIEELLKNYDEYLQGNAERYANGMAEWAETDRGAAIKYADKYTANRVKRLQVHDAIMMVQYEIEKDKEQKGEK